MNNVHGPSLLCPLLVAWFLLGVITAIADFQALILVAPLPFSNDTAVGNSDAAVFFRLLAIRMIEAGNFYEPVWLCGFIWFGLLLAANIAILAYTLYLRIEKPCASTVAFQWLLIGYFGAMPAFVLFDIEFLCRKCCDSDSFGALRPAIGSRILISMST